MPDFYQNALELFDYTQALRRDFHRHPELGFQEVRTGGIVARELRELGLEVSSGVAETGVVALLEGERPGPVALLRFDMDALPIQEETGAEYASQTPGLMHACGHDGHTAVGLTVARMLKEYRRQLAGCVKLVFQPAEEGLGGAQRMITQGVLEGPRPDLALALHLWNELPVGTIAASDGPLMAAADIFLLRLTGRGGHGALPHQSKDPLVAAAQIVTALQSIVARNVSPLEAAVVSVTSLHSGEAYNVIPGSAEMKGTIRTYQPQVRQAVLDRFQQIASGIAQAMGCQVEIELHSLTPPVYNDAQIASQVRNAAALLPNAELISNYRTMVSEDMAFMLQEIPGCYFLVGSANPEKGLNAGHHHPRFDFDERALVQAAALMASAAFSFLQG